MHHANTPVKPAFAQSCPHNIHVRISSPAPSPLHNELHNELASRPRKPILLKANAAQKKFSLTGVGLKKQFLSDEFQPG
jgi:hypothetical protein